MADSHVNARQSYHSDNEHYSMEQGEYCNSVELEHTRRYEQARRLTRSCNIIPATLVEPSGDHIDLDSRFEISLSHLNNLHRRECILVTNGSCLDNGAGVGRNPPIDRNPTAVVSFLCNDPPCPPSIHTFRLEEQGPDGEAHPHTSNRAKLRAALAALEYRAWHTEGWDRVIVATDLEYVARGATVWLPRWVKNRWRTSSRYTHEGMFLGKKIANRDLWEHLQARVEELQKGGTTVSFWLVEQGSSKLLRVTRNGARHAARTCRGRQEYAKFDDFH